MAFKKCKNVGCEIMIEVRNTAEGWRPFEESGSKHNCQFSDYAKKQRGTIGTIQGEDKDDHGNERTFVGETMTDSNTIDAKVKFVDHTAKGQSKLKIFYSDIPSDVEQEYNEFLTKNNGRIKVQGGQFQSNQNWFAIALYYEETK
jgi:hypothetical protein